MNWNFKNFKNWNLRPRCSKILYPQILLLATKSWQEKNLKLGIILFILVGHLNIPLKVENMGESECVAQNKQRNSKFSEYFLPGIYGQQEDFVASKRFWG